MRKIALFILLAAGLKGYTQQKPHYTQYILNQYILNPAITGIENYTDIKISHRHQWVGLEDGPVTTYLTVHKPIGKQDFRTTATSFDVPGENPRGNNYWEQYEAARPHHGIGLQAIKDQTGPLSRVSAYATYAYHLGLTPRTSLSAGFGVGITNLSLDASRLRFGTQVDPAVQNSGMLNKIRPDLNAGIYLYSSDYFLGLSAHQVVPQKIEFSDNVVKESDGRTIPHLFATAGYRFSAGYNFNLIPSVMVKYINPLPPQVDLNAKLQYKDLAWLGLNYRTGDGFAGMAGISISNTVNLGYSYDYTTNPLHSFSRGTHELLVGFVLGNNYGDSCPRNIW